MTDIVSITNDDAFGYCPHPFCPPDIPLAGQKLTPALRQRLGIAEDIMPKRIVFPGTKQDYQVIGDYLIPYYAPRLRDEDDPARLEDTLALHNEELIVDRANGWRLLAEAQLSVKRGKEEIEQKIVEFSGLPETTPHECEYKVHRFKILVGAIMVRFERLARNILHHPEDFSEQQRQAFRNEYRNLYRLISKDELLPLLHQVCLTGPEIDRDGILIDIVREIGKPLRVENPKQEIVVRNNILTNIAHAEESIDQIRDLLLQTIKTGKTGELFTQTVQPFLEGRGKSRYRIETLSGIEEMLHEYATLCRIRACVKGDDPRYDDIYAKLKSSENFFNTMLSSVREQARRLSPEAQRLRSMLSSGIRLMLRTAYTRAPCNHYAKEPWVPNLTEDATVMEKYMADELMSDSEREWARQQFQAAERLFGKKPTEQEANADEQCRAIRNQHNSFERKQFCSLGILNRDYEEVEQQLLREQIVNGSGPLPFTERFASRGGQTRA